MKSKLLENYIYNLTYQILIIIIPIILLPYLAKTIGVNGTGIYSYTNTIANYFVLLGMLGLKNYGIRVIAKNRENRKQLSKEFCSLYTMQVITCIVSILIYLILTVLIFNEYKDIFIIQAIYVLSTFLDITWFYSGMENFKTIVIKNTIIKVLTILMILLFVKKPDDVWKYSLIMSLSFLIGNGSLWIKIKKYIDYYKPTKKDIIVHVKPNLKLFISVIAISIYKMMDKVMIKILADTMQVGYYEYAEKINYFQILITTALGTVMLPKMSFLTTKKKQEEYNDIIYKSLKTTMFLSLGLCFGIIALSDEFVQIYLGNGFDVTAQTLKVLALSGIFVSAANIIRTLYILPKEKDNIYIYSVILGAILNVILNALLITQYGAEGAAIATVIAEISVFLYQILKIRNEINIKKIFLSILQFIPSAIIMLILINNTGNNINNPILKIFTKFMTGSITYIVLNYYTIKNHLNINLFKRKKNSID